MKFEALRVRISLFRHLMQARCADTHEARGRSRCTRFDELRVDGSRAAEARTWRGCRASGRRAPLPQHLARRHSHHLPEGVGECGGAREPQPCRDLLDGHPVGAARTECLDGRPRCARVAATP